MYFDYPGHKIKMNSAMKKRIVLTRRWPEDVEKALAEVYDCEFNHSDEQFSQQQFQEALQTADALLTTVTDKVDAESMALPNRRAGIIANFGVGYSHIDIQAAKQNGIVVTNTPDVLSDCTADIAMTLLLMAARRAGEGERELRDGRWTGWRPTHLIGSKVSGKALGIIGYGRIGRAMARRAYAGFGMDIKVFNRSRVDDAALAACGARQVETVEELMCEVDFISLHCPGGEENKHLINADRIAAMKESAFLINTARGEVVDDNALIEALTNGEIAGAGLDVFDNEPAFDQRYLSLENTVLLPHLGSATKETRDGMGYRVASNLKQFFAGKNPSDLVA